MFTKFSPMGAKHKIEGKNAHYLRGGSMHCVSLLLRPDEKAELQTYLLLLLALAVDGQGQIGGLLLLARRMRAEISCGPVDRGKSRACETHRRVYVYTKRVGDDLDLVSSHTQKSHMRTHAFTPHFSTTCHPSRAKSRATALPIPELAPATPISISFQEAAPRCMCVRMCGCVQMNVTHFMSHTNLINTGYGI